MKIIKILEENSIPRNINSIRIIMPGQVRTNSKATKIAYKILKIPKDKQQRTERHPPQKLIREWFRDSSTAQ